MQYSFFVTNSARRITLLPALATLLLLIGCTGQYRPYQVAGNSMSPLLAEGDHIFADESEQARTDVHDGDIIIFRRPDNTILLKRVLAMPGETIEGKDRKLFRNGKQLDEPYLAPAYEFPYLESFPPRTVAAGELFVAGENRDLSLDSRTAEWPPVHLTDVLGKYTLTYWHAHHK